MGYIKCIFRSDAPSGQAYYWISLDSANLKVFILHLVLVLDNQPPPPLHPKITNCRQQLQIVTCKYKFQAMQKQVNATDSKLNFMKPEE